MSGVEAQKIVAVSLGKIAASRTTRSGINLYKSLMVSSVLYKARTLAIMERYQKPEEHPPADTSETDDNLQTTDIDDYDESESGQEDIGEQDIGEQNKENQLATSEVVQDIGASRPEVQDSAVSTTDVLKSCENTTQNLDSNEITKCERCTKRRLTEVDSDSLSAKKAKTSGDLASCDENDNVVAAEPMEGVQITQLVDSFTGLLSTQVNSSSLPSTNILKSSDHNSFQQKKSNKHGLSEAFNHCSTQIKESFDTLSSPILAMGIAV